MKVNCQKVESTRNGKPQQLSGRFQTLIWRLGETVHNLESLGSSGRLNSPENISQKLLKVADTLKQKNVNKHTMASCIEEFPTPKHRQIQLPF